MQFIVFTKMFKDLGIDDLIDKMKDIDSDGMDLCVRDGYPVNPDNAGTELAAAADKIRAAGLTVPMITTPPSFTNPEAELTENILSAMDNADIRLVKLGYYHIDPQKTDYWKTVDEIRAKFDTYEKLAEKFNVKICYHTHSGYCMGASASGLMLLLKDRNPAYIGAYLDTVHQKYDGEVWPVAVRIVKEYLSIVAAKDGIYAEDPSFKDHYLHRIVPAGEGYVEWEMVFNELEAVGFDGPVSVHGEFETYFNTLDEFCSLMKQELAFLKEKHAKPDKNIKYNVWG